MVLCHRSFSSAYTAQICSKIQNHTTLIKTTLDYFDIIKNKINTVQYDIILYGTTYTEKMGSIQVKVLNREFCSYYILITELFAFLNRLSSFTPLLPSQLLP